LEAQRMEAEQKAERLEAERAKAERKEARRIEVQRKVEQLAKRMAERKKAEREEAMREEAEKRQQVKSNVQKPIEPFQTEQLAASAEEVNEPSFSGCKYYFGYLGQRDKGEEIPAACLECPRSVDCMLSDYYKSKEPVEEIKKWYSMKA